MVKSNVNPRPLSHHAEELSSPNGNKDAFDALLKRAVRAEDGQPKSKTSDQEPS